MGAMLSRPEFRSRFATIRQGLFIFENEKHVPKDLPVIHLGRVVSDRLYILPREDRRQQMDSMLREILLPMSAVHITHIEVLFAPTLGINPLGSLSALCRNRKICLKWPGRIDGDSLIYGETGQPDYYEANWTSMFDTYIIPV